MIICKHTKSREKFESQGNTPSACGCVLFAVYLVLHFSHLCCFWLISLLKVASKASAEALARVPKCRKVVIVLMEKISILDKLCSCRSYSAVVSLMLLN